MNEPSPIITVTNLKKSFGTQPILNGINLSVAPSELLVFIGPSGCGKSTLLRCLNGLEVFDSGQIEICGNTLTRKSGDGTDLASHHAQTIAVRKQVGMVFQSFNLFPHLTLLENIMMAPVVVKGINPAQAEKAAHQLLKKVGLSAHGHKNPLQLSGGQQQRGAIARALAMNPQVLLYDEPTSALDPGLTDEVWQVMRELDTEGMTQIVVTHEMRFARTIADRVIFIDHGGIVEFGPPEKIFTEPADGRTREFLKHYL